MERKAICACGQLTLSVEGDPVMVAACHCLACQKSTGSVLAVSAYFNNEQVINIYGESRCFVRKGDSGLSGRSHFCPYCGSTVFWHAEFMANHTGVSVGCFADPDFPSPQYSAWNQTQHHWLTCLAQIKASDTQKFD